MATRIFFSRRGSLLRYTVRHSHQAKKPEKLTPATRATPVRLPMAASCPIVRKVNGTAGFPLMHAAMFRAAVFASRIACCAVGGCGFPVLPIGDERAISHSPQTWKAWDRKGLVDDDSSVVQLTREIVKQRVR